VACFLGQSCILPSLLNWWHAPVYVWASSHMQPEFRHFNRLFCWWKKRAMRDAFPHDGMRTWTRNARVEIINAYENWAESSRVDFCGRLRRTHANVDVQRWKFAKYFANFFKRDAATSCISYMRDVSQQTLAHAVVDGMNDLSKYGHRWLTTINYYLVLSPIHAINRLLCCWVINGEYIVAFFSTY